MQDTTAATLTTQQVHALVDAGAALHVDIQIDRSNDRNIIADATQQRLDNLAAAFPGVFPAEWVTA